MNPIFLKIGSLKITYYGLCYAISFFIGTELCKKLGKKVGISPKLAEDYAFWVTIFGLLGGRLYYVLFNWDYYFSHPVSILAVWEGGMAIHGGIIGGIIGTALFSKRNNLSFLTLGDIAAPSLLLGQAIGRLGNLANGEVHGVPTFTPLNIIFSMKPKFYDWFREYLLMTPLQKNEYKELVPWGIVFPSSSPAGAEFPQLPLHPAMLYESLLNIVGFIILYLFSRRREKPTGIITFSYILIYGLNRLIVSFFRAEDLMLFSFRAPQIVSLIMIFIGVLGIFYLKRQKSL